MTVGFPPNPVYPIGIDTDYTLFRVYNTTETVLTANNPAWSEEILIKPAEGDEIWASNGYATIEGEILYYDSVGRNGDNKVYKLKRCLRNLGGRHTQFNPSGTWIRGFVMAEHHTQIVNTLLKVEDFVGENFTEDEETLDWRIRNLEAKSAIFDDFACPDVVFNTKVISTSVNSGITIEYSTVIQGTVGSFEIQFGDGTSSTLLSGTHNYAPNANIDPVVIVKNGDCQVVQTSIERNETSEPTIRTPTPPFSVPVPILPDIPLFNFPETLFPSVDIAIPPIIFPRIDLDPLLAAIPSLLSVIVPNINITIPSSITFSPVNIPSVITITPNTITISLIEFINLPSFSPVTFGPAPSFGPIGFGPAPSFGPIGFGPAPSFGPIGFGPAPSFGPIGFGPAPTFGPIGFGPAPTFGPIGFGPSPTFGPIGFGPAPSFGPIGFGPIPSLNTINFGPAPSFGPIGFGPAPSFGPIGFGPIPSLNTINFGPAPSFGPIGFGPAPTFGPIGFGPAPTFGPIGFGIAPVVSVNWGSPPTVTAICTVTCPSTSSGSGTSLLGMAPPMANMFGARSFDSGMENIELQYDMVGFPSEIKVAPPNIPPIDIRHDIPSVISLIMPELGEIKIVGPEKPIPSEIRIVPPDLDAFIKVMSFSMPSSIKIEEPKTAFSVAFPKEMPFISFDRSTMPDNIKVVGIPEILRLDNPIPSIIRLEVPSDLKVPLVFEGPPLSGELKVNWGLDQFGDETEEPRCFTIVPCKPKG